MLPSVDKLRNYKQQLHTRFGFISQTHMHSACAIFLGAPPPVCSLLGGQTQWGKRTYAWRALSDNIVNDIHDQLIGIKGQDQPDFITGEWWSIVHQKLQSTKVLTAHLRSLVGLWISKCWVVPQMLDLKILYACVGHWCHTLQAHRVGMTSKCIAGTPRLKFTINNW